MPKVSIITPLYNSASYISRTIQSVLDQTFQDWEMLIIDDCSTDKGVDIVKGIAADEPRIKLLKNKTNSGPALTRNRGIKAAKGRYIAFLDSDDQWSKDKLETQLKFMHSKKVVFTFSYYKQTDEKGKEIGSMDRIPEKVNYSSTAKNNKIGCLTAMYDTEFFGKVYMPLIKKRQDYALWLKLLRKVDYAYCIPKFLGIYTVRTDSVSSNKLKLIKYNWKVYREIEGNSFLKSCYYLSCIILNRITRKLYNKN